MIDIYASFMQNPSRTNKMADKSETRLFDLYNAILLKSLKVTQSKRALQKLPMVERCERRGIITKAMRTKHKLEIKLRSTANFNTPKRHWQSSPKHILWILQFSERKSEEVLTRLPSNRLLLSFEDERSKHSIFFKRESLEIG